MTKINVQIEADGPNTNIKVLAENGDDSFDPSSLNTEQKWALTLAMKAVEGIQGYIQECDDRVQEYKTLKTPEEKAEFYKKLRDEGYGMADAETGERLDEEDDDDDRPSILH